MTSPVKNIRSGFWIEHYFIMAMAETMINADKDIADSRALEMILKYNGEGSLR